MILNSLISYLINSFHRNVFPLIIYIAYIVYVLYLRNVLMLEMQELFSQTTQSLVDWKRFYVTVVRKRASWLAQVVKNLLAMQKTPVWFLSQPTSSPWRRHRLLQYSWASLVSQTVICLQCGRSGFSPWIGKIPWRKAWQPTPVFLPGEFPWTEEPCMLHSMGSQSVGHDWATKHSTAHTHTHTHTHTRVRKKLVREGFIKMPDLSHKEFMEVNHLKKQASTRKNRNEFAETKSRMLYNRKRKAIWLSWRIYYDPGRDGWNLRLKSKQRALYAMLKS